MYAATLFAFGWSVAVVPKRALKKYNIINGSTDRPADRQKDPTTDRRSTRPRRDCLVNISNVDDAFADVRARVSLRVGCAHVFLCMY